MNPLQVYITQPMYYYIVTHDGEASMSQGGFRPIWRVVGHDDRVINRATIFLRNCKIVNC